ncbi:MAG TPA: hypothetical protein VGP67_06160 [Gaiellales bacterium]|jgi:hypothetical protein|nr:hypothetical protein [Gaiellales bacterium]
MSQSPYDRSAAFVSGRYRRNRVAFCALVLAVVWAVWTLYEVATGPAGSFGWYLRAREAITQIGSGLIVAAGVVLLVDLIRADD